MTLQDFLTALRSNPESVAFTQTMDAIAANYNYTATAFSNGDAQNAAGTNEGSCKLLPLPSTMACPLMRPWHALAITTVKMCWKTQKARITQISVTL